MSHFSVLVVISPAQLAKSGSVAFAIRRMLAPYQENNNGDCPEQFLEFHDQEDEFRKEYVGESVEMIRTKERELVYSWDECFRVPGTLGLGSGTHQPPADLERVDVRHKDRYATFEEFVADWHGHASRDPKKNRYGYWENPNKRWDCFVVGGRFSGNLPVRESDPDADGLPALTGAGHADACRVEHLDTDAIARETVRRAEKFWARWEMYKAGKAPQERDPRTGKMRDAPWLECDVRGQALALGLVQIVDPTGKSEHHPSAVPGGWLQRPWRNKVGDYRRDWVDCLSPVSRDDFMAKWAGHFNPVRTWAVLDADGWHEPGKVGWWAVSDATPETRHEFSETFWDRFIKDADPKTVLAVVDCHI